LKNVRIKEINFNDILELRSAINHELVLDDIVSSLKDKTSSSIILS